MITESIHRSLVAPLKMPLLYMSLCFSSSHDAQAGSTMLATTQCKRVPTAVLSLLVALYPFEVSEIDIDQAVSFPYLRGQKTIRETY